MGEETLNADLIKIPRKEGVFLLLLFYRWIVLTYIAALAFFGLFSVLKLPWLNHMILLTFLYNFFLTLFHRFIYEKVSRHPIFIAIDVFFCFFLLAFTGGWRSPFYFYSFSPILVAVFVQEYKGGFLAATQMFPLYNLAIYLNGKFTEIINRGWVETWVANNFSFYLIAIFFAVPSVLMNQLRKSNETLRNFQDKLTEANTKLANSNKQLFTLQRINLALQSSINLKDVLGVILESITSEMDFDQAIIGFVDHEKGLIKDWLGSRNIPPHLYKREEIPLEKATGIIARAVLEQRVFNISLERERDHSQIISIFKQSSIFAVIPLLVEEKAVGVILVGNKKKEKTLTGEDIKILSSFAHQAAIAIRNARLYKESQELVVLRERNRIAMEMHDSVVQILSGAGLLLDVCLKKLSSRWGEIRRKLRDVRILLRESLENVRYSIFNLRPPDLKHGFVSFLRHYSQELGRINSLPVNLSVKGEELPLAADKEKALYRVLQEALANIVKHSQAQNIGIELEFKEEELFLAIEDNGEGFDIDGAFSRAAAGKTLGLLSMKEAIEDFRGNFRIERLSPSGTRIFLQIPV